MTRRALGRGLSALLSDTTANGDELLEVDISLIEPNPDQPRTHFGENRLEELAQSIKANGLVQPILCGGRRAGVINSSPGNAAGAPRNGQGCSASAP